MNFLNNMSLKTKLAGGYGVVLVMMVAVTVVVERGIESLIHSSKWVSHTYEVIINANAVGAAMVDMETGQRGFVIAGKDGYLEPYNVGKGRFDELIEKGRELTSDNSTQVERWNAVHALKERWLREAAEPEIAARREVNNRRLTIEDVALKMEGGPGKRIMDALRAKLNEIIDEEQQLIARRAAEQQATSEFAIRVSVLGTLLATLFSVVIATLVIRGILLPLRATNAILKDMEQGEGDLTIRVPVNTRDEIGELGSAFNGFVDKLQGIIGHIADATNRLSSAATEMAAMAAETNTAINIQAQETEQVASAMVEMSATAQEVANNAESGSVAAGEANDETRRGNGVVTQTITSINELSGEVSSSSGAISRLKSDSENIGAVLDVIKGVAEQTNLLALNAAIEAARAGEQGRGFAVVADEVRTLATRTQESAAEIEKLIEALQGAAQQAVDAMGRSSDHVASTVDEAGRAGDSLGSIATAVDTILRMNTQIAAAAEEQTSVANEISRNIVNIQDMSVQTSSGAGQISTASSRLAGLSGELRELVDQFKI